MYYARRWSAVITACSPPRNKISKQNVYLALSVLFFIYKKRRATKCSIGFPILKCTCFYMLLFVKIRNARRTPLMARMSQREITAASVRLRNFETSRRAPASRRRHLDHRITTFYVLQRSLSSERSFIRQFCGQTNIQFLRTLHIYLPGDISPFSFFFRTAVCTFHRHTIFYSL